MYCTTRRSDNFQVVQSWFVTDRKKLEEMDFADEEFLHKKEKKWRLYEDYVLQKIFQKIHVVKTV